MPAWSFGSGVLLLLGCLACAAGAGNGSSPPLQDEVLLARAPPADGRDADPRPGHQGPARARSDGEGARGTASFARPMSTSAYADSPVGIGLGQTISQPYIVAFMSEALAVAPTTECSKSVPGPGTRRRCWASSRARSIRLRSCPSSPSVRRGLLNELGYAQRARACR